MVKRVVVFTLWVITGLVVTLLAVRFGMRAVGVRDDIPLPGLIYMWTASVVSPFYMFFPASDRFDYPSIEVASLAAAGVVLTAALALYMLGLLAASLTGRWHDMRRKGE